MRPKKTISPTERTNLWTVCLTSQGVLGYLNRRISPLGAPPPIRHLILQVRRPDV